MGFQNREERRRRGTQERGQEHSGRAAVHRGDIGRRQTAHQQYAAERDKGMGRSYRHGDERKKAGERTFERGGKAAGALDFTVWRRADQEAGVRYRGGGQRRKLLGGFGGKRHFAVPGV